MLYQSLELIRQNLDGFLKAQKSAPAKPDQVVLGNIAFSTPDNPGMPNGDESAQLYMSLVNVEEEFTFKNQSAVRPNLASSSGVSYINPPLHLNLYVLFTANHKDYGEAIQDLGRILHFFQSNRVFSLSQTPVAPSGVFAGYTALDDTKIRLDLISLTFEQINHLWGSLGGKQMPFLLFKTSKIEIDAQRVLQSGELIQEIQIN
jgi:hypothetical protein